MFCYKKISLFLFLSASLQARDMYNVAQDLANEGTNVGRFISRNKGFARTYDDITSLEGLDEIPNISGAWALNLQGNNFETIDEKTFDKPEFANLRYLDLSNCNIKAIKPGAFKRLKKLYALFLGDNQIKSFTPGTFKGTKPLYLSIKNNPNTERLKGQAQRQLPKTMIFTGELSFQAKRNIAAAIGAAAVIAGAIAVGIGASTKRERELGEREREKETLLKEKMLTQERERRRAQDEAKEAKEQEEAAERREKDREALEKTLRQKRLDEALLAAIQKNDLAAAEKALEDGADPNKGAIEAMTSTDEMQALLKQFVFKTLPPEGEYF